MLLTDMAIRDSVYIIEEKEFNKECNQHKEEQKEFKLETYENMQSYQLYLDFKNKHTKKPSQYNVLKFNWDKEFLKPCDYESMLMNYKFYLKAYNLCLFDNNPLSIYTTQQRNGIYFIKNLHLRKFW